MTTEQQISLLGETFSELVKRLDDGTSHSPTFLFYFLLFYLLCPSYLAAFLIAKYIALYAASFFKTCTPPKFCFLFLFPLPGGRWLCEQNITVAMFEVDLDLFFEELFYLII